MIRTIALTLALAAAFAMPQDAFAGGLDGRATKLPTNFQQQQPPRFFICPPGETREGDHCVQGRNCPWVGHHSIRTAPFDSCLDVVDQF